VPDAVVQDPAAAAPEPPGVEPVVHVVVPETNPPVKALEVKMICSPDPKPVTAIVDPVSDCSGKPKLVVLVVANLTVGFIVNVELTELVPSLTTMV